MIVRGFRPVAWVAAIGAAALCCYMLSLQVAAERAELAKLERRIVETRQDIRSLQTELGTRGRLQQLEHWNAEVLALSAPVAGQFLENNLSLARFDVRPRNFAESDVRLASAEPAPAPAPANVQAPVRLVAATVAATPSAPSAERSVLPLIRRASLAVVPAPAPPPVAPRATRPTTIMATGPATAAPPVATRATRPTTITATGAATGARSSLLDESTLSELRAASRSERGGGTRN